jgi:hypothetical protein
VSAKQDDTCPRSKPRDALDARLDDVRIEIARFRAAHADAAPLTKSLPVACFAADDLPGAEVAASSIGTLLEPVALSPYQSSPNPPAKNLARNPPSPGPYE